MLQYNSRFRKNGKQCKIVGPLILINGLRLMFNPISTLQMDQFHIKETHPPIVFEFQFVPWALDYIYWARTFFHTWDGPNLHPTKIFVCISASARRIGQKLFTSLRPIIIGYGSIFLLKKYIEERNTFSIQNLCL